MTVTEFLLARIAEDEAIANNSSGRHWRSQLWNGQDRVIDVDEPEGDNVVCIFPDLDMERDHVARWDPARVLAECEATRALIAWHDGWAETLHRQGGDFWDEGQETVYRAATDQALRYRVLPYSAHPDYLEEWKP